MWVIKMHFYVMNHDFQTFVNEHLSLVENIIQFDTSGDIIAYVDKEEFRKRACTFFQVSLQYTLDDQLFLFSVAREDIWKVKVCERFFILDKMDNNPWLSLLKRIYDCWIII